MKTKKRLPNTNQNPAKGYEEDYLEPKPEYGTPSSYQSETEDPTSAGLLIDLISDVARLSVMLSEADEKEWKRISERLQVFQRQVSSLPTQGQKSSRLGFRRFGGVSKLPKDAFEKPYAPSKSSKR